MELKDIKNIYFLGAGGIGMSALVRYFLSEGKEVAGYDRTPTPLTAQLIEEGASVMNEEARNTVAKLHRILRPYILRRLKADVEKQMPGKDHTFREARAGEPRRRAARTDGVSGRGAHEEWFECGVRAWVTHA